MPWRRLVPMVLFATIVAGGCLAIDWGGYQEGAGAGGPGGGGSSATGAGSPCGTRADCPSGNACVAYSCTAGVCEATFAPPGTDVAGDVQGDCQKLACSLYGEVASEPDDGDIPDDGEDCTIEACQDGAPSFGAAEDGAPCGSSSALYCSDGKCVGCTEATDCSHNACQNPTCQGGTCGTTAKPAGTEASDTSTTDCKHDVCNGMGASSTQADPNDVPHDGNDCTKDECEGSIDVHKPDENGDSCSGGYCYDGGCSQCGVDGNCPGSECTIGVCNSGTCGAILLTGDACSGGWCYQGSCSQCAVDSQCPTGPCIQSACVGGTCNTTPANDGANCGGANFCFDGACVECVSDFDCATDMVCCGEVCTQGSVCP